MVTFKIETLCLRLSVVRATRTSRPGFSCHDRQPCGYEAYVPDRLLDRRIILDGDVAADVADAEADVARLQNQSTTLVDTEALARLLLRTESVASSRIGGLSVGARRLLRAEAALRSKPFIPSRTGMGVSAG